MSTERRHADDAIHIGTRRIARSGGYKDRMLRVTIPEPDRKRYDIEDGDVVDAVLLIPGNDEETVAEDRKVLGHGQLTIPAEIRDAFDLKAGDYLDLTVIPQ